MGVGQGSDLLLPKQNCCYILWRAPRCSFHFMEGPSLFLSSLDVSCLSFEVLSLRLVAPSGEGLPPQQREASGRCSARKHRRGAAPHSQALEEGEDKTRVPEWCRLERMHLLDWPAKDSPRRLLPSSSADFDHRRGHIQHGGRGLQAQGDCRGEEEVPRLPLPRRGAQHRGPGSLWTGLLRALGGRPGGRGCHDG